MAKHQLVVQIYINSYKIWYVIICNILTTGPPHLWRSVDFICGGSLPCWAETGNIHDLYIVAVEQDGAVVSHLSKIISTTCHLFLQKGGKIPADFRGFKYFSSTIHLIFANNNLENPEICKISNIDVLKRFLTG